MKTKVAQLSGLSEGHVACAKAGEQKLVLVRRDGRVFALENRCPHLNLPMSRAKVDGHEIVCPFHGSRFSLVTGENSDWVAAVAGVKIPDWSRALLTFGKKPAPMRTFPVTVEGDDVYVEV
jgi:nitrite reductase/ring-hydroxylating ferredoxin subunit